MAVPLGVGNTVAAGPPVEGIIDVAEAGDRAGSADGVERLYRVPPETQRRVGGAPDVGGEKSLPAPRYDGVVCQSLVSTSRAQRHHQFSKPAIAALQTLHLCEDLKSGLPVSAEGHRGESIATDLRSWAM